MNRFTAIEILLQESFHDLSTVFEEVCLRVLSKLEPSASLNACSNDELSRMINRLGLF